MIAKTNERKNKYNERKNKNIIRVCP